MKNQDLQTQSFKAGQLAGEDPSTPYGTKASEGLDRLAFAAGMVEGRARVRLEKPRERELDLGH